MTQTSIPTTDPQSATDFDLLSLHVLCDEIHAVLKEAELHLCQFYDDKKQAPLLLDSAENLKQLGAIFRLIAFDGADILVHALSLTYGKLHQMADNRSATDEILMTDISEAVMLLERYVEFVLLKAVPEPTLLLAIINKLYGHLGKAALDEASLRKHSQSTIIHHPAANYASIARLVTDGNKLSKAYRAGLEVVLSYQNNALTDEEQQKLAGMAQACALIAQESDSLFWQAAAVLTKNIANDLPVSYNKQRILIYLEQQFFDYLPVADRRFAQLVRLACAKDDQFATIANQKYQLNSISEQDFKQMQRFLLGPNHEMTHTLNLLIQEQIEHIKQDVDTLVRGDDNSLGTQVSTADISDALLDLARVLYLLELRDASQSLQNAASQVNAWQTPTLEELDGLLDRLMVAENAIIELAKAHTFSTIKLPLHNHNISLHRLDGAYTVLIKEAKNSLAAIATALDDYIFDEQQDILSLQNTPEMMHQVAGAAAFLRMPITARQLTRLAKHLEAGLLQEIHDANAATQAKIASAWADVLISAEMAFDDFAKNRPSNRPSLLVSEHSLNQLLMGAEDR